MPAPPPNPWPRVKELAADALDLPAAQREASVRAACAGDPALADTVLALIRSFDTASFLFDDRGPPTPQVREALDLALVPHGRLIGRYRIGDRLGAGGMGSVFEARDETLGRPVALKVMHGPAAGPAARRRFQDESRLLALLRHPHIAQVYDTGVDASGPVPLAFLAMELVPDARNVGQFVRETSPSPHVLAAMLADIADAVHHGHQRGVIHRDLKPANLLVDPDGRPKVIDFGVAKLLHDDTAVPAGTPRYMSPEQLAGPANPDVRCDVFALGVVLLELLAKAAAPRGPHPATKLLATPPELLAIGRKASAPEPDARYPSASELAADLRRFLQDRPILAHPPGWSRIARLWVRRHRVSALAAAAVTTAILLGLIGLAVGLVHARQAQAEARAQADRSTRIAGFLRNTILSADTRSLALRGEAPAPGAWLPAAPAGRMPSVPDLLAHALEHTDTSFPNDPQLRAEMTALLAQVLGGTADARSDLIYRTNWLAARDAYGEHDPRTLEAKFLQLGGLAMADPAAVVAPTAETFALARRITGPNSRLTLQLAALYAACLDGADRDQDAVEMLARLKADIAATPGDHELQFLGLDLHIPMPASPTAETLGAARAMVERARRVAGRSTDEHSRALYLLAQQLRDAPGGAAEMARVTAERAEVVRGTSGPDTAEMVDALSDLYVATLQMEDLPAAEAAAREQVRICASSLGPDSLYTPKAQGRLARILTERRADLPLAESLAREASLRSDALWTPADAWAIFHHAVWAEAIRLQGRPQVALDMLLHRRSLFTPDWPTLRGGWELYYEATILAQCLLDLNRPGEAAPQLANARAARDRFKSPRPSFERLLQRASDRLKQAQPPP